MPLPGLCFFVDAGADAIMIHSRKKNLPEIFTFIEHFREKDKATPVVLVPTSFNTVTEEEFKEHGAKYNYLCKPAYTDRLSRNAGCRKKQSCAITGAKRM